MKNKKTIFLAAAIFFVSIFILRPVFAAEVNLYSNQQMIPGATSRTCDISTYVQQIIGFGYATIGILTMFMLGIGAFQYIMSIGNTARMTSAKNTVNYAILGLVLGLLSWIILYTINPNLVKVQLDTTVSCIMKGGTIGTGTGDNPTHPNYQVSGNIPASLKERISKYDSLVQKYAKQYGVDANLVRAIIEQESTWKPDAVRGTADWGMMQINKASHPAFFRNYDWSDPNANIAYGVRYYASLLNRQASGDPYKALAMYNGGPGNPNYGYADQTWKRYQNYGAAGYSP